MKIDFKKYENTATQNFEVPSVGIEDIDRAVFDLFDKTLSFESLTDGKLKKVPVVFAAGERFALTRRNSPIRDKNNTLILPIISIVRGELDFSPSQNQRGSAITTRDQASYVIKKRLANSDRNVQNILNKNKLRNQKNVSIQAVPGEVAEPGRLATRRVNHFSRAGGSVNLGDDLEKNIYEIIQVPYPIFISTSYTVTFWCQYMTQMNAIQETYLSQFRGQAEEFVLTTESGYEFVAASNTTFTFDNNFSSYTEEERIIKSNITLTVPGYIINSKQPGLPNQVRSTFSAPFIEFGYNTIQDQVIANNNETSDRDRNFDKFTLSDVKTHDQIFERIERGQSSAEIRNVIVNPFTNEEEVQYSKVLTRNDRAGETVAKNLLIKKIETQFK